jgi:tetratricopeptide (TPR) repeat protein
LTAKGWQDGREILSQNLEAGYLPGMAGRPGSSGTSGYRQWLNLWKWFDLLSRSEMAEATALTQRHLLLVPGQEKPTLLSVGREPAQDMVPISKERAAEFLSEPKIRAEILGMLLPPGIPDPKDAPVAERFDPALLASWVADPEFSDLLFSTITPADYAPGVLWNLKEIQTAHPQEFKDYTALALAIAVVYDSKIPGFWPHHQVDRSLMPIAEISPAAWFQKWVAANESKSLMTDLRVMKPGHLKFVVDAPLRETEYTWALKNVRFPRSDFGRAFSSVSYEHRRISDQAFVWNTGDYTLSNIKDRGGICVDQAYFAMVAGKARGIPTLYFTGQGADGGHAWFGYLKSGDRWEMDAGRYENQNYAVGDALDPQNWRPISDHELKSLAEGFREKAPFTSARDDLLLARLFEERGNAALAGRAYESAVSVCPQYPEAWAERGDFLERSNASPSLQKAFHEAALKQFQNQRDLRVRHQEALVRIARAEGNAEAADAIERQIVSQNRRLRSDLSVNAGAKRLMILLEESKTDEAFAEYRRLLGSLKQTGGGNFFYDIVVPFAEVLLEEGEGSQALEAITLAKKALRPESGSILDQDFDKLEERVKKDGKSR